MKIDEISAKTIEFFKKNKKRIICTGLVIGSLVLPADEVLMEEHDGKVMETPPKQEQMIESKTYELSINACTVDVNANGQDKVKLLEEANSVSKDLDKKEKIELTKVVIDNPVFIVQTSWKKTGNYSTGGLFKEKREYQRKIRKIRFKGSVDFNDDYEKILENIRDNKDISEMFEVVSESKEIIVVNEEEEMLLDTEHWNMQVEGTNIKVSVQKPEKDEDIWAAGPYIAVFIVAAGTFSLIFLMEEHRKGRLRF